jgi:transcriptional regulator with XRE-family HTH domain
MVAMTPPSPLGSLLRARRQERRIGFKQLAAATGLEPETMRQWEVGKIAEPPLRGVLLYAREVGITMEELVEAALPSVAPALEQGGEATADALAALDSARGTRSSHRRPKRPGQPQGG